MWFDAVWFGLVRAALHCVCLFALRLDSSCSRYYVVVGGLPGRCLHSQGTGHRGSHSDSGPKVHAVQNNHNHNRVRLLAQFAGGQISQFHSDSNPKDSRDRFARSFDETVVDFARFETQRL